MTNPEQNPGTFHDTVKQHVTDIDAKAKSGRIFPNYAETTQTADIDGVRHTVHTERSTGGYSDELLEATAAVNPVNKLGDIPENHIPGNELDLGLRRSTAEPLHQSTGGYDHSRATVRTSAGDYIAKESALIVTGTRVDRPGYGTVEIKNPEARELVARLAAKKIMKTQMQIQEVKGKEDVSDRDWHKNARRSLRRIAGKQVA